jgi:hypothetical protein
MQNARRIACALAEAICFFTEPTLAPILGQIARKCPDFSLSFGETTLMTRITPIEKRFVLRGRVRAIGVLPAGVVRVALA